MQAINVTVEWIKQIIIAIWITWKEYFLYFYPIFQEHRYFLFNISQDVYVI